MFFLEVEICWGRESLSEVEREVFVFLFCVICFRKFRF